MSGRVHMVGIGGIGMSALAKLLLARGTAVSGSDAQGSGLTEELKQRGAAVTIGHRAKLVEGASRVVVSDAIHDDNPELARARELGLPVQRRSELLAELMAERRGLAVAGSHGKTTLAAMAGLILVEAGMDPTVVLGGEYGPLDGNARVGAGEWMVVEACEAYESYLDLSPEIAVVTSIDPDHLDHHKTEAHLRESFGQFLGRVAPGGMAALCLDRPEVKEAAARAQCHVVFYGLAEGARVRGTEAEVEGLGGRCRLWVEGREEGELRVGAPGMHNVVNALGATAAALRAGASVEACGRALARFRGVDRRFQVLGEAEGVVVVDDYAHHPAELTATISAARSAFPGRRLVAAFQPHLYSRTRDFAEGFAQALEAADVVVVADIYPAREAPIPGVSSWLITRRLRDSRGEDAVHQAANEQLVGKVLGVVRRGDVVLMMGAGDIGQMARETARRLGMGFTGREGVATKT